MEVLWHVESDDPEARGELRDHLIAVIKAL
jgi:hypothetical protein